MNKSMKLGFAVALTLLSAAKSFAATSDQAGNLTDAVQSEINKSAALRTDHLSVETVGGVVYVHGLVDTEVERSAVGAAAIKAAGGAHVVNMTEIVN